MQGGTIPGDHVPLLGERELDIMSAVWEADGPVTVREVRAHLVAGGHDVAYTTVQTMLNRLQDKQLVTRDRSSGTHRYAPTLGRRTAVRAAVERIVKRFFGGSQVALATHLLGESLSPGELRRVKRLLGPEADRLRRKGGTR